MTYRWRIEAVASNINFQVDEFINGYGTGREKCWYKGDKIGKSIRSYPDNGCRVLLSEGENEPDMLLAEVVTKVSAWSRSATHEFGAEVQLCIIVQTDGEDFPALNFNQDMIEKMQHARLSLDIDIIPSL